MNIITRISKRILTTSPFLSTRLHPLHCMPNSFLFSKIKKARPEIKTPSINIKKYNEELDGFLIYQNEQGNRIKAISIAFLVCFLSGFWTYSKISDDEIKVNYMIMGGLLAIPFLIFQFRTGKTLKRLILDKNGENVVLSRFAMAGFRQQNTKVKVQVLKGIGKAFAFGGSVIKGGGMYGYEQRNYWFQSKYILQKEIFQEVAQGNRVKIDKTKVYE